MSPLVTVVVCHHLPENRRYLDACLRSLEAQVGVYIEVLLMTGFYRPEGLPSWVKEYNIAGDVRWVHKVNAGIALSNPESKYFLILNDDVILSKYAIATMANKAGDYGVILNPMSNCDNGWLYHTDITLRRSDGKEKALEKRFYEYEELEGFESAIIDHKPGPDVVLVAHYVCFYATLIPRAVWERVGRLDEGCRTSHDDEDYCMRARKLGIHPMVDLESFIFHFGGRTSSKIDTDPEREETLKYFKTKWNGAHLS